MPDPNAGEQKLVHHLHEAHALELRLTAALQADIAATERRAYKERLKRHLRETREHAKAVDRRARALGGKRTIVARAPEAVEAAAGTARDVVRAVADAAQGGVDAVRGIGAGEKLLRQARTEYAGEAEEIATYTTLLALAEALDDRETAQLARSILREERRMSVYLEKLMPALARAAVQEDVAPPRRAAAAKPRRTRAAARSRPTTPTPRRIAAKPKKTAKAS